MAFSFVKKKSLKQLQTPGLATILLSPYQKNRTAADLMKMMTLKFTSHSDIWEFMRMIKSKEAEVSLTDCTIRCLMEEAEIIIATERFGAEAEPVYTI